MTPIGIMVLLASVLALPASAGDGSTDGDDCIKVEIKGILQTGMMAIGGETTGTVIRVKGVIWELDLRENKELRALAEKLNKKTVLVTGIYQKIKGVEIRERHIVKVTSLKPADEK
jgi:hypothetical protein